MVGSVRKQENSMSDYIAENCNVKTAQAAQSRSQAVQIGSGSWAGAKFQLRAQSRAVSEPS